MLTFKKILVPVDFSDCSNDAVRHARELAARFDSELHLLHVVESWPPAGSVTSEAYPMYHDYVVQLNDHATKQLAEVAANIAGSIPVQHVIRSGHIQQEIIKYITDEKIDLAVIGTHGRTGLSHWLMGSVAEKVVRLAPCPVLVVRPLHPASPTQK